MRYCPRRPPLESRAQLVFAPLAYYQHGVPTGGPRTADTLLVSAYHPSWNGSQFRQRPAEAARGAVRGSRPRGTEPGIFEQFGRSVGRPGTRCRCLTGSRLQREGKTVVARFERALARLVHNAEPGEDFDRYYKDGGFVIVDNPA